jgi:hypothetical protein
MKSRLAMLLMFVLPQFAAAQTIDTVAMRAHTRFLAADVLAGRGAGTTGERVAAEYIASELMRIGVQPASSDGYFQRVPLKRAIIANASVRYSGTSYGLTDFVWNTGGRGAFKSFRGPLLYVGSVDSIALRRAPETHGHVVVLNGAMGAAAQTYVPALIRAAAAGVLLLIPDSTLFGLFSRSRGEARYFVDANVDDPVWQADLPVIIAGPALTRQLVGRERFSKLPGELLVELSTKVEDADGLNVVAMIRGKDARLATEVIAYSAHYDHLGVSTPDARGDSIYNGFSDNAAGVAMLLGIADLMRRNPPARSLLFLFFTGEERGLLGSSYYAANPVIQLERMAGLVNLDAGAPPAPPISWRVAGGSASTLGDIAKTVAERHKWTADLGMPFPNSDYWPFLERNVPSIFIIPGNTWENISPEQQAALRARWDRYHRADDEWSADFPFSGLARYARYAYLVGRAAADAPVRPRMKMR